MQKVVNQDTAYFIVVPLLLLRPSLALQVVKLHHNLQALLVGIVTQSVLQQWLVVIEPFGSVGLWVRVFVEKFSRQEAWFILLLHETEYLVYLIWNDVTVLVDLIFRCHLLGFLLLGQIVQVRALFPLLFAFSLLIAPFCRLPLDVCHAFLFQLWTHLLLPWGSHRQRWYCLTVLACFLLYQLCFDNIVDCLIVEITGESLRLAERGEISDLVVVLIKAGRDEEARGGTEGLLRRRWNVRDSSVDGQIRKEGKGSWKIAERLDRNISYVVMKSLHFWIPVWFQ